MEFSSRSRRIAVVEDDGALRVLLSRTLRENGFAVDAYRSGAEFRTALDDLSFDLVILDVMLPGSNGFDICRWLRARSDVPIIFMSARGQNTDRIVGLELGADDYLPKPVDPQELTARVRAVLRRAEARPSDEPEMSGLLHFEGWTMDCRRRELHAPDGSRVSVSSAEFDLLAVLVDMPHRVVGRELLLEHSRGRLAAGDGSDRSVDVLISRLRRKLGSHDGGRDLIKTVHGIGYLFTAEVSR
ncbi:response regulator transcription factor [Pacificimonas sp. ICDLI1SI03]|jgi:DNA-binding response OmpR family regulator|tara:strand:+ start:4099 stop:4827 length:729 start_codon:yes stop_codon:yes gene_type:complete